MIDLKARKQAAPILRPIARVLAKTGVTPTMVTVLGLAITVVGAALIANGTARVSEANRFRNTRCIYRVFASRLAQPSSHDSLTV